jgi:hypothetical protein
VTIWGTRVNDWGQRVTQKEKKALACEQGDEFGVALQFCEAPLILIIYAKFFETLRWQL